MLMFCSLYVFDQFQDASTFSFQPLFLLGCMFFFALFDQTIYFNYIVGKSTPFSIILNSWCHNILPFLEGMLFSLAVTAHSIFIIKTHRKIQSYPDPNELISLQDAKFCMYPYLLYFTSSPSPFPFTVNTSSIPIISPISQ